MYLVALCTTASAPRCSGCCRYGVAKVLSTQTIAPRLCVTSLTASMSTTRSSGLVGDSSHTSLLHGVEVRGVDCGEGQPEPLHHLVEQPERAAVHVLHVDDVVARLEEQHQRRLGAEARRECQAVLRILERGEIFLERRSRGVAAARVLEALVLADALLREGGCQVDRLHDRAGRGVGSLADMDGPGGEAPAALPGAHALTLPSPQGERDSSAVRDARRTRAGRSA